MRDAEVKVSLSDGSFVLRKWENPCQANMLEIIKTIKHLKVSINDYLTELIDSSSKDQIKVSDASDQDEDVECDSVSGFINGIISVGEKSGRCKKRKSNNVNYAKKFKK